eukprot:s2111_g4.t1
MSDFSVGLQESLRTLTCQRQYFQRDGFGCQHPGLHGINFTYGAFVRIQLFRGFVVQALQEGGGDQSPRGDPVGILPAIPPAGDSYVLMSKKVVTKKKAQPPGVPGLPTPVNGNSGVSAPNKARVAQQQRVLETVGRHDGDHKMYSPRTDGFIQQLTGVLDFYQFSAADIASLVRKCNYDETQIQIAVANIIEDRANHEQEQWGTVKKKKQVKEEKKMKEAAQKKIEEMQHKHEEEPIGDVPRLVIEEVFIGEEQDEWSTVKKKKQVKEEKKIQEEKKIKEDQERKVKEEQERKVKEQLLKEEIEKQKKQNNERKVPSEAGNSVTPTTSQPGKGAGKGGKNGSKNGNATPGKASPAMKPSEPPKQNTVNGINGENKEGAVLPTDPATFFAASKPAGDVETEQPAAKETPQNHTAPAAPAAPAAATPAPPPAAPTQSPGQSAPAAQATPAPSRPKGGSVWNKPPTFAERSKNSNEPTPAESYRKPQAQSAPAAPKPKAEPKNSTASQAAPASRKPQNTNHDGNSRQNHSDGHGSQGSNGSRQGSHESNSRPKAGARQSKQGDKNNWWEKNDSKWNGRWDWKSWNDWDGKADGDWWSGDWKKGGGWQWQKKKDDSQGWQRKDKSEAAPRGDKPQEDAAASGA